MSRSVQFAPGEYYHLYNRGVEKRDIFLNITDYKRFTSLLYLANNNEQINLRDTGFTSGGSTSGSVFDVPRDETLVDLIAYCLMPNHFHLLVREKDGGGTSKFIQKLSTGYTMYFNKKYERTGALFQGKFKATHASEDRYLKYLFAYIHLNPVKLMQSDWKEVRIKNLKKAEAYLNSYPYFSYQDYRGVLRPESKVVDLNVAPLYFGSIKELEAEMLDWLTFNNN